MGRGWVWFLLLLAALAWLVLAQNGYNVGNKIFQPAVVLPSAVAPQAPPMPNAGKTENVAQTPTVTVEILRDAFIFDNTPVIINAARNGITEDYRPNPVRVKTGTIVKWLNHDSQTHTLYFPTLSLTSEPMKPGESWSYTFRQEGEYQFYSTAYFWMIGKIIVGKE